MTKITCCRTLEMMHTPNDSGMNPYVLMWSYAESYMALLTSYLPVRWMSLNNIAWSKNDYMILYMRKVQNK